MIYHGKQLVDSLPRNLTLAASRLPQLLVVLCVGLRAWTLQLSLGTEANYINLYLLFLDLKPEPCSRSCQVVVLTGASAWPLSFNCTFTSFLSFTA